MPKLLFTGTPPKPNGGNTYPNATDKNTNSDPMSVIVDNGTNEGGHQLGGSLLMQTKKVCDSVEAPPASSNGNNNNKNHKLVMVESLLLQSSELLPAVTPVDTTTSSPLTWNGAGIFQQQLEQEEEEGCVDNTIIPKQRQQQVVAQKQTNDKNDTDEVIVIDDNSSDEEQVTTQQGGNTGASTTATAAPIIHRGLFHTLQADGTVTASQMQQDSSSEEKQASTQQHQDDSTAAAATAAPHIHVSHTKQTVEMTLADGRTVATTLMQQQEPTRHVVPNNNTANVRLGYKGMVWNQTSGVWVPDLTVKEPTQEVQGMIQKQQQLLIRERAKNQTSGVWVPDLQPQQYTEEMQGMVQKQQQLLISARAKDMLQKQPHELQLELQEQQRQLMIQKQQQEQLQRQQYDDEVERIYQKQQEEQVQRIYQKQQEELLQRKQDADELQRMYQKQQQLLSRENDHLASVAGVNEPQQLQQQQKQQNQEQQQKRVHQAATPNTVGEQNQQKQGETQSNNRSTPPASSKPTKASKSSEPELRLERFSEYRIDAAKSITELEAIRHRLLILLERTNTRLKDMRVQKALGRAAGVSGAEKLSIKELVNLLSEQMEEPSANMDEDPARKTNGKRNHNETEEQYPRPEKRQRCCPLCFSTSHLQSKKNRSGAAQAVATRTITCSVCEDDDVCSNCHSRCLKCLRSICADCFESCIKCNTVYCSECVDSGNRKCPSCVNAERRAQKRAEKRAEMKRNEAPEAAANQPNRVFQLKLP